MHIRNVNVISDGGKKLNSYSNICNFQGICGGQVEVEVDKHEKYDDGFTYSNSIYIKHGLNM